jgi:hypothetical protein
MVGAYSKGIAGSATVNFSVSGGAHCANECPLKGVACYAENVQGMKPSVRRNLERHEADPLGFLQELGAPKSPHLTKLHNAPWVRFSAFGSIYSVISEAMREPLMRVALAVRNGFYHFPVETIAKARTMRELGFDAVRVSCADNLTKMHLALAEGLATSLVIAGPKRALGKNRRAHSAPAFAKAHELRKSGIKALVCPAIAGSAKCGACRACANNDVQVVIYPLQ